MSEREGFDFIVVGGGTAGCVLAARLSEDPAAQVLLIEAGGRDRSPLLAVPGAALKIAYDPRLSWGYMTEPQPAMAGRSFALIQARVLGGGSSINGMVYTRGARADYDGWAAMGCTGWGYTDVLPWFRRSESSTRGGGPFHGLGGPVGTRRGESPLPVVKRVLDALAEAGFPQIDDLNIPEPDGFGPFDWNIARGKRASTSATYLAAARRRPNLTVMCDATVARIVTQGGRATAVELLVAGERRTIRCDREIVLSAGAIGSARLLLLSGIGPAEALHALGIAVALDQPHVGAHLQNHMAYKLEYGISEPISAYRYTKPWTGLVEGLRYLGGRRGFLSHGASAAGGFFRSDESLAEPDMQMFFVPALIGGGEGTLGKLPQRDGFSMLINQGRPHSRGTVTLRSADPAAPPVIDPRYLSDPRDLDALAAGAERMRAIADAPALSRLIDALIVPGPDVHGRAALADDIRRNADNYYHVAGTCRMAPSAGDGVTDPELRVHGIAGLRVADASIMPALLNGNTNAAVMMIAERAAAMMRG